MVAPNVGANPPPSPAVPAGNTDTLRKVALGCAALFAVVFVVAFAGVWYLFYYLERQSAESEKAYYTAAPGTKIYLNKADTVPADLNEGFVPFAFHYPDTFIVVPDKASFIRLEKQENGVAVARFTVTSLAIQSPQALPSTLYPPLMNSVSKSLAVQYRGYQEISQKAADFKSPHSYYDGWDMRWQADPQNEPAGSRKLYGRVLFLRDSSKSRGVMVTMTEATSDPGTDAASIGERGDFATMLQSFRLLYVRPSHATAAQEFSRSRSGGRH